MGRFTTFLIQNYLLVACLGSAIRADRI